MGRALIVGLPRSGTTWMGDIISRAPGVRYVYEPDNRELDPFAWVGTRGSGVPFLSPGDPAADYHLMWRVAFGGGWPDKRGLARMLRRAGTFGPLPPSVKVAVLRAAARAAARRGEGGRGAFDHVVVKSVAADLAAEWICAEFDPSVLVLWRHPLNLIPSWMAEGWTGVGGRDRQRAALFGKPYLAERFEGTAAWPPATHDRSVGILAWMVCARSVLLLETAKRHPEWTVVSHEEQAQDPLRSFQEIFGVLGLTWTQAVEDSLRASDAEGEGYTPKRRWHEEATRWRTRLTTDEQAIALDVIRRFEDVSVVAREAWRRSPAVSSDLEPA